jgi:hypothetical protein
MKVKLILSTVLVFFIVLIAGCSKEDTPEEFEPDYGTLTAFVNDQFTEFNIIDPWIYKSNKKQYRLSARGGLLLSLIIHDSISKPGSYSYDDGVRAAVQYGSGYESFVCGATNANLNISIFSEHRAKGTFEFLALEYFIHDGDTITLCETRITNGVFDINRIE